MTRPITIPRPEPAPQPPTPTPEPGPLPPDPNPRPIQVRPVNQTPTEAIDYAALSSVYGTLLAAAAVSARGRKPVEYVEVPVLAAATFALSKLIVHEKIESWIREPFVDEQGGNRRPKGRRLRYAVGELLTCTRCTGAWTALGLVALRLHAPATGRTVTTVLAASAGNDMLHAAFQWLCAGANAQSEPNATPRPVPVSRSAA